MQAVLHRRIRNELPHPFCVTLARPRTHGIGIEVALLQRKVEKLRGKTAREQFPRDGLRVAFLLGCENGRFESARRSPPLNIRIDFRLEIFGGVDLAFTKYP